MRYKTVCTILFKPNGPSVLKFNSSSRLYGTSKRKFPLDPKHPEKLPVFEYPVSKSTYNRVFVWGSAGTGALGVPYKNKDLNLINSIKSPKRLALAEHHEVTNVACGLGFTIFAVNSSTAAKLYGTGLNMDSQLSYHEVHKGKPLEVVFVPQPIHLPLKNPEKSTVKRVAAGRAHSLVLTDEGLFTFGNNSYGQCGRKIVLDENYEGNRYIHCIENIEDKLIKDVVCGQDHSLALTEDGAVYGCGWGSDGQTGIGSFKTVSQFTRLQGDIVSEKIVKVACRADFVLAINDKGDVFGWGNNEYGQLATHSEKQQICNPTHIQLCQPLGKIKDVAAGGTFCVVMNEEGHVSVWGYGILGTGPAVSHSKTPVSIPPVLFGINDFQPDTRVTKVSCGVGFICAITNNGDLYAWGRNNHACLGLGDEKNQYFPLRVAVSGLVTKVSCGVDHAVAVCKPFI